MENENRLVKAKEVEEIFNYEVSVAEKDPLDAFDSAILNAATVDAVEVVHGRWLDIRFDPMWRSMLATCSHCKVRGEVRVKSSECGFAVPDSDYCPHCGAFMEGGTDIGKPS